MHISKPFLSLTAAAFMGFAATIQAQVRDVSFTLSPTVGYTLWDSDLNLGNSPYYGLRAGFGIGPLLEIRAAYEQSFDIKAKLRGSSWGALQDLSDKLEASSANIRRIGGDLKLNLWNSTILSPYVTAGAGVMRFKYDDVQTAANQSDEQLYGVLGAGAKINLGRRMVLSLEARNYLFNVSPGNQYLAAGSSANGVLSNWTGQLSLDFYFGGTNYSNDAVSRAYRNVFTDGFRGLKWVIEPGIAHINFNNESPLADQWLVGASAGVDFNSLMGLRGFYYTSTQTPDKLNLKLDSKLQMYGAELLARLNQPRGVTPYLTIGGGYLNIADNYNHGTGITTPKSGWMAKAGLGVEIPLHRIVALYGSANALLLEQENPALNQLTSTSAVKINMMYQMGLRFNIGRKANGQKTYQTLLANQQTAQQAELNRWRANYERQLAELRAARDEAQAVQDHAAVAQIEAESQRVERQLRATTLEAERIDSLKLGAQPAATAPTADTKMVALTPAQLDQLVARVVQAAKSPSAVPYAQPAQGQLSEIDRLILLSLMPQLNPQGNKQVEQLMLQQILALPSTPNQTVPAEVTPKSVERRIQQLEEVARRLQLENDELRQRLDNNADAKSNK